MNTVNSKIKKKTQEKQVTKHFESTAKNLNNTANCILRYLSETPRNFLI